MTPNQAPRADSPTKAPAYDLPRTISPEPTDADGVTRTVLPDGTILERAKQINGTVVEHRVNP